MILMLLKFFADREKYVKIFLSRKYVRLPICDITIRIILHKENFFLRTFPLWLKTFITRLENDSFDRRITRLHRVINERVERWER